jgi:AcrR family transcriptional regulator
MFTEMNARSYNQKKRAASQEATRQRIVEATMELHETLGPANTTFSAVAERAGVQRLTVYRHFPDETALFQACTSHWLSLNPPPDPAGWAGIEDRAERCRTALERLYAYFRATQKMWRAAYRDVDDVPALQEPMSQVSAYLGGIAQGLADGWPRQSGSGKRLKATLHHAVQFSTWASLVAQGLSDREAARLVLAWITRGLESEKADTK